MTGCLCTCGHRTTRHRFLLHGATPCVDCECNGFVHADNDPMCAYKNAPMNKTGKVPMDQTIAQIIAALEPILGPTAHEEMVEEVKANPPWQDV